MIKSNYFYFVAAQNRYDEIEIELEHLLLNENETIDEGKKRIESDKNFLNHGIRNATKEEWDNWKLRNPESAEILKKCH